MTSQAGEQVGPTVQSVSRAIALVEALAVRGPSGLVELGDAVGLRPSTAHRLLATLVAHGWVSQVSGSSDYDLGHRLVAIAGGASDRIAPLRASIAPLLEQIREMYDETTNLVVLDGDQIVYVDQRESSRPVRMFSRIGNRVPAHASGAGKALLAFQEPTVLEELFERAPLPALTPRTITSAAALGRELARIRSRRFALDREEYNEGVTCVAAPLFDRSGQPCAAVSVSGPSARMRRLSLIEVGERIADLAWAKSAAMGFVEPSGADPDWLA